MAASDETGPEAAGRVLLIKAVVVSVRDLEKSDTGEIVKKVGAVLILQGGETISTTAPGVLRCVKLLMDTRGRGEWSPPAKCLIEAHKSKMPSPWLSMRILTDKEAATISKQK